MNLRDHPEYSGYLRNLVSFLRCRKSVEAWRITGMPVRSDEAETTWTPDSVQAVYRSLSRILCEYNTVLWESYSFCRSCGGQCCMTGGSFVSASDLLALALLNLPFPILEARIEARARDCIYRTSRGCAWPEGWRTLKCWLFYCLGPEGSLASRRGEKAPAVEIYRSIASRLQAVTSTMPDVLNIQHDTDGADGYYLHELPLHYAASLGLALHERLVKPLDQHDPFLEPSDPPAVYQEAGFSEGPFAGDSPLWNDFIASAAAWAESALDGNSDALEQVNSDLEQIELLLQAPGSRPARLLRNLAARYSTPPPNPAAGGLWEVMDWAVRQISQGEET